MSKLKQNIAVTAVLAGLVLYTMPAQSAPCFLPGGSGDCEIGGGDVDIGGGSDETCEGYDISENDYKAEKYKSGCYSCSECTVSKTNKKMYKCTAVSNATWNSLYSVCCTDGLTYDADERQCCANGKCEHTCPEPRVWSTSLKSCECPSGREENDRGDCCDYSEHADGSICCPENKHNENGTCVCDDGYIPDGTGCKLPNCGGYDVTDTSKYDTNCYVCEACADDGKKFKCTQSIKDGYKLDGSKCVKKQSCADYSLVSESACDTSKNTFTASKTDDYGEKCGTCESKPKVDCEAIGKHNSYGPWCSECGKEGGKPMQDTDGCWICKKTQTCSQKYSDKNGYKVISASETCDSGYTKSYMGVKDDYNESYYTCIPEKIKTCEDYGYITLTASNYNEWMRKCRKLTPVKPEENLECWRCDGGSGSGTTDDCSGTIIATISCSPNASGNFYCSSYVPTCQSKVVEMKVFSSSGALAWMGGIGSSSGFAQIDQVSTCKFYGPTHGLVGSSKMSGNGYQTWSCSYSFTK